MHRRSAWRGGRSVACPCNRSPVFPSTEELREIAVTGQYRGGARTVTASKIAALRPGVSGTAYHMPGKCTGHPAFFNYRYAVDEHVGHADGESIGIVVCRHIVN